MLIFYNHTSAKNPDFRQKSAQNTEKSPQKTLFLHLYHFISLFDHTHSATHLKCVSRGYSLERTRKSGLTTGKNVASVAYVVDNSQICIERHNRTLTSVDAGGSRVRSLLGEDEMGRASTVGLGIADAMWGDDFYDWVEKEF